jgi:hypothetical protein
LQPISKSLEIHSYYCNLIQNPFEFTPTIATYFKIPANSLLLLQPISKPLRIHPTIAAYFKIPSNSPYYCSLFQNPFEFTPAIAAYFKIPSNSLLLLQPISKPLHIHSYYSAHLKSLNSSLLHSSLHVSCSSLIIAKQIPRSVSVQIIRHIRSFLRLTLDWLRVGSNELRSACRECEGPMCC